VFELQGSLFFGTASQLHAALEPETGSRKYVILNMRRVQSLDVTATHVLEQIKDQLEKNGAYLVFCDIPKDLPSGLKMKRFLKDTGVVRPSNKAFAFRQLEEALQWVEARELPQHPQAGEALAQEVALDLSAMPVLAKARADEVAALYARMPLRSVHAGKKLFKAGGNDASLYLLRSGSVQLSLAGHKKVPHELARVGLGGILCSGTFLHGDALALEAVALSDVEVYAISRADFDVLAREHGALATTLLGEASSRLATQLAAAVDSF